tara:strand:- start:1920 stop:2537 length:618 start_codon:yes stop_codon:yes gene_type:complete
MKGRLFVLAAAASMFAAPVSHAEGIGEKLICMSETACRLFKYKEQVTEIGEGVVELANQQTPGLKPGPLKNKVVQAVVGGISLAMGEQLTKKSIPAACTKPAMLVAQDFVRGGRVPPAELVYLGYQAAVASAALIKLSNIGNCQLAQTNHEWVVKLSNASPQVLEEDAQRVVKACANARDLSKAVQFAEFAQKVAADAYAECGGS